MLGDSRLGTISNRRLKAPTLSKLRPGLEVDEGGSTRGSGIRIDRGFKPILEETSILLVNFNFQQNVSRRVGIRDEAMTAEHNASNSVITENNYSTPSQVKHESR